MDRIPSLETGLLALARRRCAPDLFQDESDPQMRAVLLEAHLYETAAKSLELRAERAAQEEEEEEECDCEDCQRERAEQRKKQKETTELATLLRGFVFPNSENADPDTASEGGRSR